MGTELSDVSEERLKQRIAEAAQPLGLLEFHYQQGTLYVQDLAVARMRYDVHVMPLTECALNKRAALPGEPVDIEGTYADSLLYLSGFFPEFLMPHHENGFRNWNGQFRHSHDGNQDTRNTDAYIIDVIKGLYGKSLNPFAKEKRNIISSKLPSYIRCLRDTRMKFWEDNPNVAESIKRLLIARSERLQEMSLAERIADLSGSEILLDRMLHAAQYRSDN